MPLVCKLYGIQQRILTTGECFVFFLLKCFFQRRISYLEITCRDFMSKFCRNFADPLSGAPNILGPHNAKCFSYRSLYWEMRFLLKHFSNMIDATRISTDFLSHCYSHWSMWLLYRTRLLFARNHHFDLVAKNNQCGEIRSISIQQKKQQQLSTPIAKSSFLSATI